MPPKTHTEGPKHFLSLAGHDRDGLVDLLARAWEFKRMRQRGESHRILEGKSIGLIFEKASTRTRASFAVAAADLGAQAMDFPVAATQLGRGEPLRDASRVLSRYFHALVIRTFGQEQIEEWARWSTVPVINGLTDLHHPCQILADLLTAWERLGTLEGLRVAWVGDGNNVAHSWIEAASILGFDLRIACPEGYEPDAGILAAAEARAPGKLRLLRDPREAVSGATVVTTDVWASMGQEEEQAARVRAFEGFCVDRSLMALAAPEAIVLHCLPAHRGEEIEEEVLEGPQSAVFDEAENRLHVQKALLESLIGR